MKKLMTLGVALLGLTIAMPVAADGGGMMGGGMMGGGMLVVADDGSLLLPEMGMMMGAGGDVESSRELVCISPEGQERWRVTFEDGWPGMPVTDGDLVVLTLSDGWWMEGGDGHDHGDGHGDGHGFEPADGEETEIEIVALDLASGAERWRANVTASMGGHPDFSPDGSRIYLLTSDMSDDDMHSGSWRQSDAAGSGMMMTRTLTALDRTGQVLWTLDVSDDDHGGMGGSR